MVEVEDMEEAQEVGVIEEMEVVQKDGLQVEIIKIETVKTMEEIIIMDMVVITGENPNLVRVQEVGEEMTTMDMVKILVTGVITIMVEIIIMEDQEITTMDTVKTLETETGEVEEIVVIMDGVMVM